ncbi:MAG: D-sedoheptulose 7-phosphate isomerase [Bacteroidetes bacterium]|nr:D-sedoheptulose 7-phosphate isomerase [Bacteroidota bacterium]
MEENRILSHLEEAAKVLGLFISDSENIQKIAGAGNLMVTAIQAGGKIFSCGNGGSHCDAMHFAEELTGRYRENRPAIAAIAISDSSHITCVGNDYGFDKVYSRYLEALGKSGDVLLAISTSGNSNNIIEAAKAAHALGMKVVGLAGNSGGTLAGLCDIEIRVPFTGYADRIQEVHIKVIHSLIDYIESRV